MTFKQQIAAFAIGNATSDQLPEIAISGIKEGLDSPSLWILAGLGEKDHSIDKERYFQASLDELGIVLPNKRKAALIAAQSIVEDILSKKIDVVAGVTLLQQQALDKYDFHSESKQFVYDSIGFAKAYGIYDTHCELSASDHPWQEGKTNAERLVKVKQDLLVALKDWKQLLDNEA